MADEYESHYQQVQNRDFYNEMMVLRDQQRAAAQAAYPVVEGERLRWELNPQGYTRWYMAPTMTDLPMNAYTMYAVRIPASSRTGLQRIPGDEVAYVWKGGTGHSMIDGVRYDWEPGDVLQIPSRPAGCVVQHFNDSDVDIEVLFCRVNSAHSVGVDRGVDVEQLEPCPDFSR